jgi:two-component system, LuxR family, response regulator FixJ
MRTQSAPLLAVIDVVAENRGVVREALRACEYRVQEFGSAEEFLSSGTVDEPSLSCVVLDLGLPSMSALELQSHLTQRGLRVPIVLVASDFQQYVQLAPQAALGDATALLYKPFDDRALLSAILSASVRA